MLNKDVIISIHASINLNTQARPKGKSSLYVGCFQCCVGHTAERFIACLVNLITQRSVDSYGLRSNDRSLSVPFACTELVKRAFAYSAPSTWNMLQKDWKITELVSLNAFKSRSPENPECP